MSIGAVLDLLRGDFPDVTISKIRFLEAEGLVTPERTASGYRRFTAYDCARLRFVLTAQRDQYLPLKVIKAQLDAQPDGELPHTGSAYGVPRLVPVSVDAACRRGRRLRRSARAPRCGCGAKTCLARSGVDERPADRADQGGRDHAGHGRLLRRAFGGDRAVRRVRWRSTAWSRGTCGRFARRPTGSPT